MSASFSYDVFLSFRGSDTRYGFTGNLYKALCDKGIHVFIDDEELQRGDEIREALIEAIKQSRMAIVVFSMNYASSSFCLDELVKIIDCVKEKGRLILPIFYDVRPSHVRGLSGSYAEALAMHQERFKSSNQSLNDNMGRLQKWKMALNQAANVSGKHYKLGNEYEHEFIGKIVKEVSNKINRRPLHVADYPVGMECRVQKVKSLLQFGSDTGVHIVGIYGIGGMGKTTLARAVYNSIADQFEGLCFLDGVRENAVKQGLVHLQEMLLSEIVGEKDIRIGSVSKGISIIKHRLHRKKVLLILDDVDKLEQVRATAGERNWFGSGSRVIITTRDKHLLQGVDGKYEVEDLNEEEALELLSWNAFKDHRVDPSYKDISNQAVAYASGLPLALEVIGSLLFGKGTREWESALDQFKKIPNRRIQEILKVSYNALEENQQRIFLDIACCLKGYELEEVEDILGVHYGVCMKYDIGVLVDKSLIKIENGCVTLHELIEAMGKEIDRQESPKELGKHRRLWFHKDIIQVLAENTGTSDIEIICLDFPLFEEDEEVFVEWDGEAFKKMENLKTLIIRNSHFSKGPAYLPNSLRVLEWWTYPLQDLPTDFHPSKLAICKLPRSCFTSLELATISKACVMGSFPRSFEDYSVGSYLFSLFLLQKFMNLTVLNFDGTECLTKIPDISSLQNLEKLTFECCENLVAIHGSVGFLDKLKILSAFGCSKLTSFPPIKLISLERLDISSCSSLESFPEILGKMENITQLELKYTPLKEFPFSFRNLARLQDLVLVDCGNVQLPSSIVMLPELAEIFALGCKGWLLPKQDENDEEKELHVAGNTMFCLPGSRIPEWLEQQSIGPSLSFWFRENFPVMDLCFVIGPMGKDSILFRPIMTINGNTMEIQSLTDKRFCFDFPALDYHILIIGTKYMKFGDNLDKPLSKNEWNHVVVSIALDFEPTPKEIIVKQTALHVIKPESSMDDIQFTDPCNQPSFKEKQRLVDTVDCHRQFMQHQTTLVSLEPHVRQGRNSLSLIPPHACKNNLNWDSFSTGTSSIASVQEYEIASKKLRLDMGILQFVQQRKRLAILGLQQQRRMASLDLLQRRGRELLSLLCSPSLELMVSWQRRCITTFQGLQEQHLPSTIKQNFEGCNGINEAKVNEVTRCKNNDGNDNERNPLVEQLLLIKFPRPKRIPEELITMEFEEAHNNFLAIRLLYRLLEDNSIALQNSNPKHLVEWARDLLKSLLDVAVESVFETHLKVHICMVHHFPAGPFFFGWQESNSLVAANISQSSVKYPTCSKMTSEKDEQPQFRLISKKKLPELSKFSISDDGGTKCKTLGCIGEESSTMQQNAVKATGLSDDIDSLPYTESIHSKQQQNDVNRLYGDGEDAKESLQMFDAKDDEQNEENNVILLNRIHEAQRNSDAAGQVEHLNQRGEFSDDLVNAIKRIESRILAFQICSNVMDSTKNSAGHLTTLEAANSDGPAMQRNSGVSGSQISSGKSLLKGHRLMSQKTFKSSCKDENSIAESAFEEPLFPGKESLNQSQMANQNFCLQNSAESAKNIDVPKKSGTQMVSRGECLSNHERIQNSERNIAIDSVKPIDGLVSGDAYFETRASKGIPGFRVPLNQDNNSKKHSMLLSKTNRENSARKNPVAWSKTDQNPREMISESSYTQKSARSKTIITRREKPPPHQMVMKPTLLDQKSSDIKVNSHKHRGRRRTFNTSHLEPRNTRVLQQHFEREESSSSSSSKSDSDSSCWSSQQGRANSSSIDSEDYSLSDGTQSPSSSGRMVDAAYEGSSEETINSYLEMDDDPSPRLGSFKSYRHHDERYHKETTGRLRRLRNKLGLIFHHHHHHHHHHDHGNTHSREGHGPTTWNHLKNVFHHKDKHGVLTKNVEKTKGGHAAKVLSGNQVGQFNRLAEGLLRHIRHSKKPKPPKFDVVKQSRNKPHGHNQKKLRWLQMLRKQRGVKMKNQCRTKMGFMSQNSLKNY
ncbi:uncharacterized protein LOC106769791 isoform X6 [Vigna radiata var. radiata]|uniref:Uncharacterized protein LOC106769791 isoform X6 n=1 Tax=Vigna radiata var. radiata TaxID=3916 RepID=A0A3Q0FC62_VIGRR|nr:uncharacterized protein LOC106769791 isoform X6 [Vigna radiata var. radiata]